jgi:hypothetical protein
VILLPIQEGIVVFATPGLTQDLPSNIMLKKELKN